MAQSSHDCDSIDVSLGPDPTNPVTEPLTTGSLPQAFTTEHWLAYEPTYGFLACAFEHCKKWSWGLPGGYVDLPDNFAYIPREGVGAVLSWTGFGNDNGPVYWSLGGRDSAGKKQTNNRKIQNLMEPCPLWRSKATYPWRLIKCFALKSMSTVCLKAISLLYQTAF